MIGIIICSRLKSTRLPNKAHLNLEGKTAISHLVNNLTGLKIPIVVTVPNEDFDAYFNDSTFPKSNMVLVHNSEHANDPLARTYQVAKQFGFSHIIRITHDKIFIDTDALLAGLKEYLKNKADYLYLHNGIPGTNFEIISYPCLAKAAMNYKNVEYISYAVRGVSRKTIAFLYKQSNHDFGRLSLLIDYPEDFRLMQILFSALGPNARLKNVLDYVSLNSDLVSINKKPRITIYTCAFNAEKFLSKCIESVIYQSLYEEGLCEYIIIDDHSRDKTLEIASLYSIRDKNIKVLRNEKNLGLSTSSNIALNNAKGEYVIRIDADDYFYHRYSLLEIYNFIKQSTHEVVYPDNYFGSIKKIQKGNECHHIGGAMFNKNALNFIKFTDGLRGYEGYDLFLRAKDRLRIGYLDKPIFIYSQHDNSMSRTNLKGRVKIKKQIEVRIKNEKTRRN